MKEKKIFHVAHVTESPAADTGFSRLYPKADGWYTQDSDGNEVRIEGIVVLDNAGTALDQKPNIQFLSPLTTAVDGDKIKVGVDTEGYSWEDASPDGIKPVGDANVRVSKLFALEIDLGSVGDLETHLATLESLWEAHSTDATLVVPKTNKGIEVGGGLKVDSDGKIFADKLKEIIPMPLIVGTDGRIRTVATVDTYTLTITVTGLHAPISGTVWITGNGFVKSSVFSDGVCVISDIPNGTYNYTILTEQYQPYFDEVTVSGNTSITATLTSQLGQDPGDVIEGRAGERITTGSESNLTLARPVAVVERNVNYDLTLPAAGDSQTVEITARKAQDGEALTLSGEGGFVLDGEINAVLTTTQKGAWVKVKAMDVDGTYRWVVIMDSGHWELGV